MRTLYPEFDDVEYRDVIEPLAASDDGIRGSIGVARAPSAISAEHLSDTREELPFAAVTRALAEREASGAAIRIPAGLSVDDEMLHDAVRVRLSERLHALYLRPLVAHLAAVRDSGLLIGDTPEERYLDYIARWEDDFRADLHDTFPLLLRQHARILDGTVAAFAEIVDRLAADADDLTRFLGCGRMPRLIGISTSGDTHGHGRAVAILRFADGRRLAYKPRSVDGEAGYQALCARLAREMDLHFAAARVLARPEYGYVEWVHAQPSSAPEPAFVERSGELGALLYALNARDMHTENVMATADGPVPVDLETVLQPRRNDTGGAVEEAIDNAHEMLARSVYGVGVLPLVIARPGSETGHVDAGFLGLGGRGPSPYRAISIVRPFRDDMVLELRSTTPPAAERSGSVTLDESAVRVLAEAFHSGFERVYRRIVENRELFVQLVRQSFAGARLRYIHTPTVVYAQSIRMLSSARALADEDVFLAITKRIGIAGKRVDPTLIGSEAMQLAARDIPFFTCAVDGTEIRAEGRAVARLRSTPWAEFTRKVAGLGEADLARQNRMIGAAFTAQFPDNHLPIAASTTVTRAGMSSASELETVARDIGDALVDTVAPDRFGHLPYTWIGPLASYSADRPWPPGVLGYDLYTGRVGPALALAALGRVTGQARYIDVAEQIFATSASILAEDRWEARSLSAIGPGAFTGLAGTLYALAEAGRVLGRPEWQEAARRSVPLVLGMLPDAADDDDVIRGRFGALLALRDVSDSGPDPRLEATVASSVRAFLDSGGDRSVRRTSGFAHGMAGVLYASAVLPLGRELRDEAVGVALEALDGFYDAGAGDWRTARDGETRFATGWCHGSAGIALALAAARRSGTDVGDRLEIARERIRESGFGRNITLCHGDLGNLDVLRFLEARAGTTGEARAVRADIAAAEARLTSDVLRDRLRSRGSRYAHTNSLMVGSSGVLVSLLRRLDPSSVSSPVLVGSAS